MTTTTTFAVHGSGLSFRGLLLSEWIKLSSLRSTVWCYVIMLILNIGLGVLLAISFQQRPDATVMLDQGYWVQSATIAIAFSQLVVTVLGALVITGEYGTGMIRSTLTAVPKRLPALFSQATVFGVVTVAVSLARIFTTALLAQLIFSSRGLNIDLADGRAWGPLTGGAAFLTLAGLIALYLGTIVRNNWRHLGRTRTDLRGPDRLADLCRGHSGILGSECLRIYTENCRGAKVCLRGDPRAEHPRRYCAHPRTRTPRDDRPAPVLRDHRQPSAQAAGRLTHRQRAPVRHSRRSFSTQNGRSRSHRPGRRGTQPPPVNSGTMTTAVTINGWTAFWATVSEIYKMTFVQVILIIVVAVALRIVLRFAIDRVVNRIVNGVKKRQNVDDTQALMTSPLSAVRIVQRTRTLGSVLNNIVAVALVIVAVLSVITTINDKILGSFALITAALGAGLGFGAQNIVKDVLNGLFMVAEDQLGVGDVVDLGPATGVVETVGIRITQIRDVNGTVWFVRNGEIVRVGNMSQGWSRVIIDLAVPYDADVAAVQEKMVTIATQMASDLKWRSRILEKPEIWGIESISAEAIVIRLVVKTRPGTKDDVARDLRARLKIGLDAMGIKLPALNSIVLSGFEGAESIAGARPPRTAPNPIATTADPKPSRKPRP